MGSEYTNSHLSCPDEGLERDSHMARQPRFQYLGALYHVMARGNGGDAVFVTDDGRIDEDATKAIRRGWYLGKDSFRDKLLKMLEKPPRRRSRAGPRGKGGVADSEGGWRPAWIAGEHSGFGSPRKKRLPQSPTRHLVADPHLGEQRMDCPKACDGASWFGEPVRLGRQSGQHDGKIDQKDGRNVNPCTLTPFNGNALNIQIR